MYNKIISRELLYIFYSIDLLHRYTTLYEKFFFEPSSSTNEQALACFKACDASRCSRLSTIIRQQYSIIAVSSIRYRDGSIYIVLAKINHKHSTHKYGLELIYIVHGRLVSSCGFATYRFMFMTSKM